jgi:hypothetical protein
MIKKTLIIIILQKWGLLKPLFWKLQVHWPEVLLTAAVPKAAVV